MPKPQTDCRLDISVLSRGQAELALSGRHSFTHLISIYDSNSRPVSGFVEFVGEKLALGFDDVTNTGLSSKLAGYVEPSSEAMGLLVQFEKRMLRSGDAVDVLIHCGQGVSRSGAAAVTALFLWMDGNPSAVAAEAHGRFRHIKPNPLMLALADEVLDAGSRLFETGVTLENLRQFERGMYT